MLAAFALLLGDAGLGWAQSRPVRVERNSGVQLRLTEVLRIGSEDGPDAMGRAMSAAFDRSGRILIADDLNHRVSVFAPDGRLVRHLGRRGRGPGEFEQPWLVAVDRSDTVFVLDAAGSRLSVFAPDLSFRRSISLPPHWLVTKLKFLPSGELLVAAFGRGEARGMHVLDRSGRLRRSFGPAFPRADLAGYEASLLGGSLDLHEGGVVYANKSPYAVSFHGADGSARGSCHGQRGWTTAPAEVIERSERADALHWNRFVHATGVISLGTGRYLHVIRDPVRGRAVLDLLASDCRLLWRRELDDLLSFADRRGDRLLAISNADYPQVVVYRFQVVNRRASSSTLRRAQ